MLSEVICDPERSRRVFRIIYIVCTSTPLSLTVVVTLSLVTLSGVICHPERSRRVFCIIYIVCTSTTLSVTYSNYAQCDNISTSLTVLASTPLSPTVVVTPSLVMLSGVEGCSVLFISSALRLRSV
jgi:hypothetical protein